MMRFPRADDNAGVAKREPIDLDALRRNAQGAVLAALARADDAFDILAAVAPLTWRIRSRRTSLYWNLP